MGGSLRDLRADALEGGVNFLGHGSSSHCAGTQFLKTNDTHCSAKMTLTLFDANDKL